MEFIKPKNNKKKVDWSISDKTLTILSYYSKYTQYKEEEVVDLFLENLLSDKGFVEWLNTRRYKKRIDTILSDCKLVTKMECEETSGETKETNIKE